jgi:2-oxoglutarate dehydrogenase E1 component
MIENVDQNSFLYPANDAFIMEMYKRYLHDPASVDVSWQGIFREAADDLPQIEQELKGASWAPKATHIVGVKFDEEKTKAKAPATADVESAIRDSISVLMMIRVYRVRGHLLASLDPLGIKDAEYHPELDPKSYGFSLDDHDRPIFLGGSLGLETATVREVLERLRQTYCHHIGTEYMHIQDPEKRDWIKLQVEASDIRQPLSRQEKHKVYSDLVDSENFENFLKVKFPGTKRFGLEGGEVVIPGIEEAIEHAVRLGVKEVVLGMAHRGRLNVLSNIMGKSNVQIFSEFKGDIVNPDVVQGSGDVKYHLGTSSDREFNGQKVHLSLTANPSHLEAVNPVVVGKVRAKEKKYEKKGYPKVLGILLHGDAAFAGQGIVPETLCLSQLNGYRSGGTLHIIINNQIGFTTSPQFSRSSPYPSDVAKGIQSPIFHVNGDDPEAVVRVMRIAIEYRQKFRSDVVVDIFCYRRHGHNEADEPAFTQPLMYQAIRSHASVKEIYEKRLLSEKSITPEEVASINDAFNTNMQKDFDSAKDYKNNKIDWLEGAWSELDTAKGQDRYGDTGLKIATLKKIGLATTETPDDFDMHPRLARIFKQKIDRIKSGENIDWATAEAMAYGGLLLEGLPVRLSGQDCGRGTFSQRHAILYDQKTGKKYVPLNHITEDQAELEVIDSPLSELAVLGFEYGYSSAEPHELVLWEAQFGDFVNGAQIIIDQFISSSEHKWHRMIGLVMLLPHGYEGQGPEHSSARPERFLQMAAEDNMQIVNCTTPANYFHVLRRQLRRKFRKPLIIMTPKSLLRHELCVSSLKDMGPDTHFELILPEADKLQAKKDIHRVVLCSGKIYYDLLRERRERGIKDIAILRIEQLYPFPAKMLGDELKSYKNAEVVWCQEEPYNMGSWYYIDRRIEDVLVGVEHNCKRPRYVGRAESSATATGREKQHIAQQNRIINMALERRSA